MIMGSPNAHWTPLRERSHGKPKPQQNATTALGGDDENEQNEDQEILCRRELLKKLKEAKEESKAINIGQFVCGHVRCPLCHSQMSKLMSESRDTPLWCSNKCNLLYKPNNKKARYLGELSARINAKFVNPNQPPDCSHSETAALIHLNGPKVNEDLQDTLLFIFLRKVAGGRCDFVIVAEEEDELEEEYLETIYKNRNEQN